MDFWDLTKLLFRRWYVAAPLLLLSLIAAGWVFSTTKPDYIATSYVQLIPPTAAQEPTEGRTTRDAGPRNPWLELGLNSLSRAAMLTVQDKTVLEQLDRAGLSDNVVVAIDNQMPVLTITVVGESEKQVIDTSDEMSQRVAANVATLQADYGARRESFVTTRRLDRGTNIEEANSKVKRAVVAVGGAGLLLSVALTIATDAVLRRGAAARARTPRQTRPAGLSSPDPEATIVLPMPAVGRKVWNTAQETSDSR